MFFQLHCTPLLLIPNKSTFLLIGYLIAVVIFPEDYCYRN
ncbi:MAG: potassium-transporting ATPase subunit F [Saprospiraceae bacterium]|nr:potassium-transporting ATPase subunit F [Saprospiraceae bacterium]MBP6447760.1 potassium-transporting ATPase subunit F [Saprospiraceae bacterium]